MVVKAGDSHFLRNADTPRDALEKDAERNNVIVAEDRVYCGIESQGLLQQFSPHPRGRQLPHGQANRCRQMISDISLGIVIGTVGVNGFVETGR